MSKKPEWTIWCGQEQAQYGYEPAPESTEPSWLHAMESDGYHLLVDTPDLKISWTEYHGLVISYKKES